MEYVYLPIPVCPTKTKLIPIPLYSITNEMKMCLFIGTKITYIFFKWWTHFFPGKNFVSVYLPIPVRPTKTKLISIPLYSITNEMRMCLFIGTKITLFLNDEHILFREKTLWVCIYLFLFVLLRHNWYPFITALLHCTLMEQDDFSLCIAAITLS